MRRTQEAPIPRRIPPLQWRKPAFLWTPLALALALGGLAFALNDEGGLGTAVVVAGALVFAAAFLGWGFAWALNKPPRTRRVAVSYLLIPGVIVSLAAPFVFESLAHVIAAAESGASIAPQTALPDNAALATVPLALLVGLPMVLISGLVFAFVAFAKQPRIEKALPEPRVKREEADARRAHDFQPFV